MDRPFNLTFVDTHLQKSLGISQEVSAQFGRYRNGASVSISLICVDGDPPGEPWMDATVNVPEVATEERLVAVKNYSEYEGMVDVLIENGYIEAEVVKWARCGFVEIPVYRLTDAAYNAAIEALNKFADQSEFQKSDERMSQRG